MRLAASLCPFEGLEFYGECYFIVAPKTKNYLWETLDVNR